MSLEERHLDLEFALGQGSFGADGSDTVTLQGLRASAAIAKAGGVSMSQMNLRVYGMTLSDMNRLSTLGKPLQDVRKNTVRVTARSGDNNGALVFAGNITEAWVDMADAPNSAFVVQAYVGLVDAVRPIQPSSFEGSAEVVNIMASLAAEMGLTLENSGVTGVLINPYFPGTALQQVQACAAAANINYFVDDTGRLAIWPIGGSRGGEIPLISKETGMVGYPTHTQNGIVIQTLFNPGIAFGGRVRVESILTPAAGEWTVFSLAHQLDAETPGGSWFTRAECTVLGYSPLPS